MGHEIYGKVFYVKNTDLFSQVKDTQRACNGVVEGIYNQFLAGRGSVSGN